MWMKHDKLAWLTNHIPTYVEVQPTRGKSIGEWLQNIAPEFLAAFPAQPSVDLIKVHPLLLFATGCVLTPDHPSHWGQGLVN
jgi:hypothetical protein